MDLKSGLNSKFNSMEFGLELELGFDSYLGLDVDSQLDHSD